MSVFGWHYPPGLEHDKRAPWNQEEATCHTCGQVDCTCKVPDAGDVMEGGDD